jgi:hypothetical protein
MFWIFAMVVDMIPGQLCEPFCEPALMKQIMYESVIAKAQIQAGYNCEIISKVQRKKNHSNANQKHE